MTRRDVVRPLRSGALAWLVPASVGLHAMLLVVLPAARRVNTPPPLPAVTMIDAPEPPKPREPEVEPPKAPAPAPERPNPQRSQAPKVAPVAVAPLESQNVASTSNAADEVPVDFTAKPGTTTTTATRAEPSGAATGKPAALTAAPFVAASSLARSPRSPGGLDAELERNYPLGARRAGVSGKAVLRVRIAADGRVAATTTVSESFEGFAAACERTVRAGRWEPPMDREGHAVSTEITYVCRFEVRS